MTTSADQHVYPAVIAAGGHAACAAWDEFAADKTLRPSTLRTYRYLAEKFLSGLQPQGISLAQITPAMVQSYLDHQNGSHLKYLCRVPLRRLFDSLIRQGVLATNPAVRARVAAGETVSEHGKSPGKTCRRCGQRKSLDEFRTSNRWQGGRLKVCRVCESAARHAGRVHHLANKPRMQRVPDSQSLSLEELHHKMHMLIVYGVSTEEKIMAECYGKDSPRYKVEMAKVWTAFENLFALLRESAPSLAGESGSGAPV